MIALRFLRFLVALATLALVRPALGAPDVPPSGPMRLVVFGELPREVLRERLAKALDRPVVLAAERAPADAAPQITVTWRGDELAVAYDEPGRGTVSRVVPSRPKPEDAVDDAVLLSTSLVRNEADELLGQKPTAPPPVDEPIDRPAPVAAPPPAPKERAKDDDEVPAVVSLVHPLASNAQKPYARTRFGLNLVYGRAGELDHGLQLGIVNVVTGGDRASGRMSGVQLAPFFGVNVAGGVAEGLQLAHLANVAGGGLAGAQLSLLGNVSGKETDGAQIAMGLNVSGSALRGTQLAAVNVAGDVTGLQLGFVNVAKRVNGATLGLVNVADDVDGVPIGLISVTKSGGIHPVVWSGTSTYANVGLKFATRYTYTMIAGHWARESERTYDEENARTVTLEPRDFLGGGFFLGGHLPIDRAFVDFDLSAAPHYATRSSARSDNPQLRYHEVLVDARARIMGGVTLLPHLSLFVGASALLRVRIVDEGRDGLYRVVPELFGGVQF